MKVLIADDSGVMRKIIVRAVASFGTSENIEAGNGTEAFQLFQQHQFDLVLSDWNMPGMTGIELLKAIRGMGSQVPVVLITTETESSRVLEAIRAGVTDYLVKPFEREALEAKLSRFFTPVTA